MILLPGLAIARNAFRTRIEDLTEVSSDFFRAKPANIDVFRHVNHANFRPTPRASTVRSRLRTR